MGFYLLRFITFFRRSIVPYVCMCLSLCVCAILIWVLKKSTLRNRINPICRTLYAIVRQKRIGSQMKSFCVCVVFIFSLLSFHSFCCYVLSNKYDFYIYPCYWLVQFKALHRKWFGCDWLRFFFPSIFFRHFIFSIVLLEKNENSFFCIP